MGVHTVQLSTPDPCHEKDDGKSYNTKSDIHESADRRLDRYEKLYSGDSDDQHTDIEEVWFAVRPDLAHSVQKTDGFLMALVRAVIAVCASSPES